MHFHKTVFTKGDVITGVAEADRAFNTEFGEGGELVGAGRTKEFSISSTVVLIKKED